MRFLGRRRDLDATVDPAADTVTLAGRLARLTGQVLTVDRLTMDALHRGVDTDLAIDVRRALGLPMGGEGGS